MSTVSLVHLLVLPEVHLLDLAGPAQVFSSERLALELRYISPVSDLNSAQGLALHRLEALPDLIPSGSCLVVVGSRRMQSQLGSKALNRAVRWLQSHADQYTCIAAVCSGALVLARAGLLDGKRCTTHHDLTQYLHALAPAAQVVEDCLFVAEEQLFTSAGITTGVDLCLYLTQQWFGPARAQRVARDMVVYQRRTGSSTTQSFWLEHRNHVASEIHRIQDKIMQSPGYPWRLSKLAAAACLSERQFRRRFLEATGETLQNYLQLARLELSRQLLQQTSLNVADIAERCGFADERSLRRLWARQVGVSPSAYRLSEKM